MKKNGSVDIKVSFQCNNLCQFCIKGDKRYKSPDKKREEIRNILKKELHDCKKVIFTGGEPTIQENLIGYVKYARKLGYRDVTIQTNGRMLAYKNYCLKLKGAGVTNFLVAIHGSNEKIHDCLTSVSGSFSQTFRGLKNLKEINQVFSTQTVITKINYKNIPDTAKMLAKLKITSFQFAFIHINNIIQKDQKLINKVVPRYCEIENYVKKGLEIGLKSGIQPKTEAIPYCFLKDYEKYITENDAEKKGIINVYDDKEIIKNLVNKRKNQGKAKGPNCLKCKYNEICEGPWKEYPEIFGWEEFKPVKNNFKQ